MCLKHKFLYADGLKPTQVNAWLNSRRNVNYIFQDDLKKQDRQTDKYSL